MVLAERGRVPPVPVVLWVVQRVGVVALDWGPRARGRARLRPVARRRLAAARGRALGPAAADLEHGPAAARVAARTKRAAVPVPRRLVAAARARLAVVQVVVKEPAQVVQRTRVVLLGRLARHGKEVRVRRCSLALANLGKDELGRGRGSARGGRARCANRGRVRRRRGRLAAERAATVRHTASLVTGETLSGGAQPRVVWRALVGLVLCCGRLLEAAVVRVDALDAVTLAEVGVTLPTGRRRDRSDAVGVGRRGRRERGLAAAALAVVDSEADARSLARRDGRATAVTRGPGA